MAETANASTSPVSDESDTAGGAVRNLDKPPGSSIVPIAVIDGRPPFSRMEPRKLISTSVQAGSARRLCFSSSSNWNLILGVEVQT